MKEWIRISSGDFFSKTIFFYVVALIFYISSLTFYAFLLKKNDFGIATFIPMFINIFLVLLIGYLWYGDTMTFTK